MKKTVENCLKEQYGSNHIALASPHLDFQKFSECWILNDAMVQLRTIRFMVFKWIMRFNRTTWVGTDSHLLYLLPPKTKTEFFFLRDHNGNKATQLFCVIPAIAPCIYIQFFDCWFIWKSNVNFSFIEFIFVMVKNTYLLRLMTYFDTTFTIHSFIKFSVTF